MLLIHAAVVSFLFLSPAQARGNGRGTTADETGAAGWLPSYLRYSERICYQDLEEGTPHSAERFGKS
jgi:hypothetical protein